MKSLARILKEREEREAKRKEKERIKKEKEDEKKRLKKIAHVKKLRQKQNKRYYSKKRKKILDKRNKIGDERAYFMVLLTKNRKRIKRIGASWWKTDAYKIYNEALEQNRKDCPFPVKILLTDKNKTKPILYELLLIKNVKEDEDTIVQLRNNDGKFVDNVILDSKRHVIVAKAEWYIDETFNVYGYHPIRNRKNYNFILNEIVLNNIIDRHDIRTIMTYNNKLFIRYTDDFDFVLCKNKSEAHRLYSQLEKDIPKQYKKTILFMGDVARGRVPSLLDEMMEKTGWARETCKKPYC